MSRKTVYETRKSSTLLSDSSWIKKNDAEDEDVDQDPNFAKSVLSSYSQYTVSSSGTEELKSPTTTSSPSTSVQALTKRFSSYNEDSNSSTLPSTKSSSTYYSKRTSYTDDPAASYTTTTITKSGNATETTTTTTTKSVKSPTQTFTDRVLSSKSTSSYSYTPKPKVTEIRPEISDQINELSSIEDYTPDCKSNTSTTETVTVKTSSVDPEDKLYDTLIPQAIRSSSIKSDTIRSYSSYTDGGPSSYTTYSTKTRSSDDGYDTILTRTSSQTERSSLSSPASYQTTSYSSYSDDLPSSRSSYTIKSTDDYTSNRRPSSRSDSSSSTSTVYTSYKTSRSDDGLSDAPYSRTSIKSTYSTLDRPVLEKDLCTSCRKVFSGDAKMVLPDMKINCHAFCFKCGVCNNSLSHLKAGDTIWVYHHTVHCENCFEATRAKWRR
ncbi:sciellin isoform X3 [Thalassophryne amazonica]|uniref:sciellin isoform X3 n=1 Tax=Thalassophryne amazonica TaxID=390379 RepID=UPI00147260C5|nr:sciellin isoform X3 [Thalassophryne amazonica]